MLQELMTAKELKALQTDQTKEGGQLVRILRAANRKPSSEAKRQFVLILDAWRSKRKGA